MRGVPQPTKQEILKFLHTDPMYDMEQNQRYDQILTVSDNFAKLSKNLQSYLNDGKKFSDDVNNIILSLQNFEIICTNPSFSNAFQMLKSLQSSLLDHLQEISKSVIQPLKNFIKDDIDSLILSHKDNLVQAEKFSNIQEKVLVSSKKQERTPVQHAKFLEVSKSSAISFFKFVHQMDLAEASFDSVLGVTIGSFLASILHSSENPSISIKNTKDIINSIALVKSTKSLPHPAIIDQEMEDIAKFIEPYWAQMDLPCPPTNSRLKQGWLWKKTGRLGSWERRFVICSNGTLSICHSPLQVDSPPHSIPLLLAQVKPFFDKGEVRRNSFSLITRDKIIHFQAPTHYDCDEWINVIQNSILDCLSNTDSESNAPSPLSLSPSPCADCGAPCAEWVILNRGAFICDKCAGAHRSLPTSLSVVRSLALDTISPIQLSLLKYVGNDPTNEILESELPPDDPQRIRPDSTPEDRVAFIRKKYVERSFCIEGETPPDPFNAIQRQDYKALMKSALLGGLDVSDEDGLTPLHAAVMCGDPISTAIITQNFCIGPQQKEMFPSKQPIPSLSPLQPVENQQETQSQDEPEPPLQDEPQDNQDEKKKRHDHRHGRRTRSMSERKTMPANRVPIEIVNPHGEHKHRCTGGLPPCIPKSLLLSNNEEKNSSSSLVDETTHEIEQKNIHPPLGNTADKVLPLRRQRSRSVINTYSKKKGEGNQISAVMRINQEDNFGWSPLCYALFYKNRIIAEFLLMLGAKGTPKAAGIARKAGLVDLVEKLNKMGEEIKESYAVPSKKFIPMKLVGVDMEMFQEKKQNEKLEEKNKEMEEQKANLKRTLYNFKSLRRPSAGIIRTVANDEQLYPYVHT